MLTTHGQALGGSGGVSARRSCFIDGVIAALHSGEGDNAIGVIVALLANAINAETSAGERIVVFIDRKNGKREGVRRRLGDHFGWCLLRHLSAADAHLHSCRRLATSEIDLLIVACRHAIWRARLLQRV